MEDRRKGRRRGKGRKDRKPLLLSGEGKDYLSADPPRSKSGMAVRNAFFCFPFSLCCNGPGYSGVPIDYKDFLAQCKTGDILLFEGKGVYSRIIQCAGTTKYSHIGMIVKMKVHGVDEPMFFVWESTKPDGSFDFITRTDKDGPRMVNLHEKLYEYSRANYSIHYRPLWMHDERLIGKMENGEASDKSWDIFIKGSRALYETNYGELANAHKRWVVGSETHTSENQKALFCSEALMWYYKEALGLSLLDESRAVSIEWEPENFTPEDFAESTEGIPFAYSVPPQATFGGQYIVAARDVPNPLLKKKYLEFTKNEKRLEEAFTMVLRNAFKLNADSSVRIPGIEMPLILFGSNAPDQEV